MSYVGRRWAHQAGSSWRKWGDPLLFGKVGPEYSRRLRVYLFWTVCWLGGAVLALAVWTPS